MSYDTNYEIAFVQKQLSNVWPNWRISRKLGKGSYGNVYEIERDDLGARYTCALKVLHMEADTASALRFLFKTPLGTAATDRRASPESPGDSLPICRVPTTTPRTPSQRELYGTPPLVLPPCRHLPHPF